MNIQIRADWTNKSEYYIDFERGMVAHSQAASRGQTNRIFNDQDIAGTMKYLTYPQASDFYKKNKTA